MTHRRMAKHTRVLACALASFVATAFAAVVGPAPASSAAIQQCAPMAVAEDANFAGITYVQCPVYSVAGKAHHSNLATYGLDNKVSAIQASAGGTVAYDLADMGGWSWSIGAYKSYSNLFAKMSGAHFLNDAFGSVIPY